MAAFFLTVKRPVIISDRPSDLGRTLAGVVRQGRVGDGGYGGWNFCQGGMDMDGQVVSGMWTENSSLQPYPPTPHSLTHFCFLSVPHAFIRRENSEALLDCPAGAVATLNSLSGTSAGDGEDLSNSPRGGGGGGSFVATWDVVGGMDGGWLRSF